MYGIFGIYDIKPHYDTMNLGVKDIKSQPCPGYGGSTLSMVGSKGSFERWTHHQETGRLMGNRLWTYGKLLSRVNLRP